jgi:acetylornithine deacetylase/succinyl-diaminopimelate desuccinylase-like protein
MNGRNYADVDRREFIQGALALSVSSVFSAPPSAAAENAAMESVLTQVPKLHGQTVKALQSWIALPSIAAENRNFPQGAEYMAQLARDAGFGNIEVISTSGTPGVFGMIDAGAPASVGVYFMYDVKQFDPSEWSSPPLEGRLVQKEGLGTVCMGRGAVNQKGPETSFLAALHAFKAANVKLPVNLVLVCEGEEEIGSPHFAEVVQTPRVMAELKKCMGVFMPSAAQDIDGSVQIDLGAKGVVELELISSGEKWGRGPKHDVHSSLEAMVDSPSWHLVHALNSLIKPDVHTPAVEGFFDKAKPLTPAQAQMIKSASALRSEQTMKDQLGVERWAGDKDYYDALIALESQPTINIEGLVAGYTGPGGKTVLGHRAVAKIDMRLVPDMTAQGTLELLKEHLQKHGFGDVEVNMSGGYDPTQTNPSSKLIQAQAATYKNLGLDPLLGPRSAGSWPGYIFTGPPLSLPAGHFGLGHGTGAHAPNEYFLIDSTNPKLQGLDGAVASTEPLRHMYVTCTRWLRRRRRSGTQSSVAELLIVVATRKQTPAILNVSGRAGDSGLDPDPIIHCTADSLLRAQVALGRLNRNVPQKHLDLLELSSRRLAEPRATAPEVVRSQFRHTDSACRVLHNVPDGLRAQWLSRCFSHLTHTTKDFPAVYPGGRQPIVHFLPNPIGNRNSPYVSRLAQHVDYGPMFLSPL